MRRNEASVLVETPDGLFCPAGDFFVDPWNPVGRAVITHAHGDHARLGSAAYLCAAPGSRAAAPPAGIGRGDRIRSLRAAPAPRRRHRQLPSRGPRAWLGADPGRRRGRRLGRGRRLQARGGSDLCAVRAGPLRHVHHRVHLRPADLSLGRHRQRDRRHLRLVAVERDGRQIVGAVLLHDRQGAARARRARDATPIARCSSTA